MASVLPRLSQAISGGSAARAARDLAKVASSAADARIHVRSTMNNIHITVESVEGATVSKASGGMLGYKHRSRAAPEAAKAIAQQAASKAVGAGHELAHVHFSGPSRARGQVLLGIVAGGLRVLDIKDVTPIPTNGCRPKHARRL